MFWTFLLAHMIADYPLQPDWLVRAKRTLPGLALHVAIHLLTYLLLLGSARATFWTAAFILAGFHFLIDLGKNWLGTVRPQWIIWPYLIDQLLHYFTIYLVSAWFTARFPQLGLETPTWVILATIYLVITVVWYITERILTHTDRPYRARLVATGGLRMLVRGLIFTVLLLVNSILTPAILAAFIFPNITRQYTRKMLLIDLGVSFSGFFILKLLL